MEMCPAACTSTAVPLGQRDYRLAEKTIVKPPEPIMPQPVCSNTVWSKKNQTTLNNARKKSDTDFKLFSYSSTSIRTQRLKLSSILGKNSKFCGDSLKTPSTLDALYSARVQLNILGAARPKLLNVVVDLVTGAQLKLYRIALAFIRPAIARVGYILLVQDRLGAAIRATR